VFQHQTAAATIGIPSSPRPFALSRRAAFSGVRLSVYLTGRVLHHFSTLTGTAPKSCLGWLSNCQRR